MAPLVRHLHSENPEQLVEVLAPGDRDGGRTDRILETEIPADDPRDQLAHRRVRVRVGAAGDRDHRGELGVAQAGERAPDPGPEKSEPDRRTAALPVRPARAPEQARATDG